MEKWSNKFKIIIFCLIIHNYQYFVILFSVVISKVDSMLGRRENPGEHEAMRKMKNEFMVNWDGLRTKDKERVLVLAATNRPFDLDEAVIRRLPRRYCHFLCMHYFHYFITFSSPNCLLNPNLLNHVVFMFWQVDGKPA